MEQLQIISAELLTSFLENVPEGFQGAHEALHDAEISTDAFSFCTSVSSVYSSKIEGEDIDLDSNIKHKKFGIEFLPDYTKKIDDLYNAYSFAKTHELNEQNILKAHRLLSEHIVARSKKGRYRNQNMYVSTPDRRIEYGSASSFDVVPEMKKFHHDVAVLLLEKLSIEEIFYYASMIHLTCVKIHPWNDGNGRSARLIEKWFLSEMLDEKAWFVQCEKYYYQYHHTYYKNIRLLGLEYPDLDYMQALPFLLMLPHAVI